VRVCAKTAPAKNRPTHLVTRVDLHSAAQSLNARKEAAQSSSATIHWPVDWAAWARESEDRLIRIYTT